MEGTWKSLTAGILDIISGVGVLFTCLVLALAGGVGCTINDVPQWVPGLLIGLAVPLAILAILAVIGGVFAVRRKSWGMALTGSIATFFCCFIFGIVSIVLISLSRSEFK